MCFSATASFAVAAPLLPLGVYCLNRARRENVRWMPFAAYPLAFGLQQAVEGALWIGISSGDQALIGAASRGFLFFSHFFWLFWVPMSILALEPDAHRRRILAALAILGGLYGASLFLPILLNEDWLRVAVVHHSIVYKITLIYDGIVNRQVLQVIYAAIIVASLFICSVRQIKVFAMLMLVSVIVANLFFRYAFTSVWCFFAAILSLYVLYIVREELKSAQTETSA